MKTTGSRALSLLLSPFTVGLLFLGTIVPGAGAQGVQPGVLNTIPVRTRQTAQQTGSGSIKAGKNVNVSNEAGAQSETSVAVDPTNPKHIITSVNDLTGNFTASAYESTDGGATFKTTYRSPSTDFCYDTWDAFNLNGD